MSAADSLQSTGNKVLDELIHIMITRFEHLVERGFLAPHFLNKMVSDPTEILKFLRQNRNVVGDQLNRRLDPSIRPTPAMLERNGIVPPGYFTAGHEKAIAKRHRRRSTAGQDLAMMIALRPKPQQIIEQGIVNKQDMEQYIDIDDGKNGLAIDPRDDDDLEGIDDGMEVFKISILSTLLFKTISEALRRSCLDTTKQEAAVLGEMQEMNNEMKILRNTLDKYFLSPNPDIASFQKEEDMVRDKFHGIQQKLLHISTRQNRIHEKLKILHSVERGMIELQNQYDKQLGELRQNEEKLLFDLREQRIRRDKAIKIMLAERSHQDWATAKLTYTIEVARNGSMNNGDATFVDELETFLNGLKKVSMDQKRIVLDYDEQIDRLEQTLLRIRHDMGKVRTMTFKKIYDLHKQVQIAESIELGLPNRRLSVASATELERERRHHNTKIQRQLNTLNNQDSIKNRDDIRYKKIEKNLNEIVDIQQIMSDSKLKSFFSVFVQVFNQTVCDIELMYRNLNSKLIQNGVTTKVHLDKITKLCQSLYGIHNVMNKIDNHNERLDGKLRKCMLFITILKQSIAIQYNVNSVSTHRLNMIIIYIARKLCTNEHVVDEIERTHDQQIPRLAEIRSKDIFQAVICDKNMFQKKIDKTPKNIEDAGNRILDDVFGIFHNGY